MGRITWGWRVEILYGDADFERMLTRLEEDLKTADDGMA